MSIGANIGNNKISKYFKTKMYIYPVLDGRISLSYNEKDFSIGITMVANQHFLAKNKNIDMGLNQIFGQLSFTKRFNFQNKFINKTADRVNSAKSKFKL